MSACVQVVSSYRILSVERAAKTYGEVTKDLNLPVTEVKEGSKKLLQDVYVDNSMTGSIMKEVDRMFGVKLSHGIFSGTTQV